MRATLLLVLPALFFATGAARADGLDLARKLVARGIYEPAESLAHGVLEPAARVVEAQALAGRARAERAPELLAAAGKLLAEAEARGVSVPPDIHEAGDRLRDTRGRGRPHGSPPLARADRRRRGADRGRDPGRSPRGPGAPARSPDQGRVSSARSRHPELGGDAASRRKAFDDARALLPRPRRHGSEGRRDLRAARRALRPSASSADRVSSTRARRATTWRRARPSRRRRRRRSPWARPSSTPRRSASARRWPGPAPRSPSRASRPRARRGPAVSWGALTRPRPGASASRSSARRSRLSRTSTPSSRAPSRATSRRSTWPRSRRRAATSSTRPGSRSRARSTSPCRGRS